MEIVVGAICSPEEFAANLKLDFSEILRKKGSIDYLPWAEIVRALHQKVPYCTYGFKEDSAGGIIFYTPDRNAYLRPYLTRYYPDKAIIVESPAGFFPISNMAARHKAMVDPDIRAIDNNLRRSIAKEIGVHTGIGLQLWASQDPYDDVEEEAPALPRGGTGVVVPYPKTDAVSVVKAPGPSGASASVSVPGGLDKAADAAGLTEHGKETVAKAVRADSWALIPDDKAPKIIQILGDADKVKLLNAGKNTQGKTINPMTPETEIQELVNAFKAAAPA